MANVAHAIEGADLQERGKAVTLAHEAIASGGVAIVPSDTGYVALCLTDAPPSQVPSDSVHRAWLAPDHARAIEAIPQISRLGRKVLTKLNPGPAIFRVALSEDALAKTLDRLRIAPSAASAAGKLGVHIAKNTSIAGQLAIALAPKSVIMLECVGQDRVPPVDVADASAFASALGIEPAIILDDGAIHPAPRAWSVIELTRTGGLRVLSEGGYERRYVLKISELNVLFVCTGNTCRSPMAEAIAVALIERNPPSIAREIEPDVELGFVRALSAGVAAVSGSPSTPEAVRALKDMGIAPPRYSSRPLTKQLIDDADMIFTMTASHAASVRSIAPSAAPKVQVLDPSGEDVPDPIGLPLSAYHQTALRLKNLIIARFKELNR